jgi:hypothetical protein
MNTLPKCSGVRLFTECSVPCEPADELPDPDSVFVNVVREGIRRRSCVPRRSDEDVVGGISFNNKF